MTDEIILDIRGITKTYRGKRGVRANDNVDVQVRAGEVVGVLGHNGAGKTTLANQIVGLARPDSGSILLAGVDALADPAQARRLASVQAQANVPITGLTPRKAVELVGRLRDGGSGIRNRVDHLLSSLDLDEWANTPAEKISGGIARLTSFCMAAVVPGRLVILDEPTNDVDPVRRRLLWQQIRELADSGAGVLLVTHNVREAERVVDYLVILDHGKVVASDTPAHLSSTMRGQSQLEIERVPGTVLGFPEKIVIEQGGGLRDTLRFESERSGELVAWAERNVTDRRIEGYTLTGVSLEDVYLKLVGTTESKEAVAA